MAPRTAAKADWTASAVDEPHLKRRQAILKAHPEIEQLYGWTMKTPIYVTLMVIAQVYLAWWSQFQSWTVWFLTLYVFGATLNHACSMAIHECAHNLGGPTPFANRLVGLMANLPLGVPSSQSFRRYHLEHHAYQGVKGIDMDLPSEWEARMVGNSKIRKAIFMLFFAVSYATRPGSWKRTKLMSKWEAINWAIAIPFDIAIYQLLGPGALGYLLMSTFFGLGFHPTSAHFIQRHYIVVEGQETYSYYGPLNNVAFNVGYHNEHHDFPRVPWTNLPKVRAIAPEFYNTLKYHTSWCQVLYWFITDPKVSPFSRVVRTRDVHDNGRRSMRDGTKYTFKDTKAGLDGEGITEAIAFYNGQKQD